MPNNFKSLQQRFSAANAFNDVLVGSETSTLINNVTLNIHPNTTGKFHLILYKYGETPIKIATHKPTSSSDDAVIDMLDKSIVLEENDSLMLQVLNNTGTVDIVVHYMEKTTDFSTGDMSTIADVSLTDPTDGQILVYNSSSSQYEPTTLGDVSDISDTGDLPQQSSGTEPFNRYMKNFGSLSELQNNGDTETPAEVLKNSPDDVVFVACNSGLTGSEGKPLRFTFNDIIQALLQGALEDLVLDINSPVTTELVTGTGGFGDLDDDGAVGTSDLIELLTVFGGAWSDTNSSLFVRTKVKIEQGQLFTTSIPDGEVRTIDFALSDVVTTEPGSQNVVKDATNNLIKIQSSTTAGHYPLYAVQDKYLYIGMEGGTSYHVINTVAGETNRVQARIKIYDEDDNQLGTDIVSEVASQTFESAGPNNIVGMQQTLIQNFYVEQESGHTGGWNADDFDYLTVQLEAYNDSGSEFLIAMRNCRIELLK